MINKIKMLIKGFKRNNTEKKISGFIHIPKTGGTYLGQLESDKTPVLTPFKYFGHRFVVEKNELYGVYPPAGFTYNLIIPIEMIKQYFMFSTVRNIFDWLVSYYYHCGGLNPKYRHVSHYDYLYAQKGFDYLLKKIIEEDRNVWPNRKFIHAQLFADNGDLIVDWINYNERLDEDLEKMAQHLNIQYIKKEKQRVGKDKDYRSFYNDELIELVYKTWGRELKLFGFTFDGTDYEKAYLKNLISAEQKEKYKYFWLDDCLTINGKTL
ncbi:MAG: sulfotransferase family 2 domain-containing protein [Spirochaetota bacterium]|nr:sulfotransferase family 2 domain-containing protein [Spirochaetota bacterium]